VVEFSGETYHPIEASDMILAGRVADTLEKHYPGHGWMVHVNSEQGIVVINNAKLAAHTFGNPYGYIIPLSALAYEDEIVRNTIRAGGEILERMGQHRGSVRFETPVKQIDGVDIPNKLIEVVSR
jgi:hypothetical protein